VHDVLVEAERRGIPASVCTSGASDYVIPLLRAAGLSDLFNMEASIFIDRHQPNVRYKPEPDGYLMAFDKLKVDPSKVIIFEDTPTGALAGLRSGATVILQPSEDRFHAVSEIYHTVLHEHPEYLTERAGRVLLLAENQDLNQIRFPAVQ
jgi:beta-phosphoglucomutase-like phosphatase (HAD superfamily)